MNMSTTEGLISSVISILKLILKEGDFNSHDSPLETHSARLRQLFYSPHVYYSPCVYLFCCTQRKIFGRMF